MCFISSLLYNQKKNWFCKIILCTIFILSFNKVFTQDISVQYTFPTSHWNYNLTIGEGTELLSFYFNLIPNKLFENEFTGIENATNTFYRTALLFGIVVPLSTTISNGTACLSYALNEKSTNFQFENQYRFWDNTLTTIPALPNTTVSEIQRNFNSTIGFNSSIFLRNSVSKNVLQSNKSSILESSTIVASAISQLRSYFQNQTFSGTRKYSMKNRFDTADSLSSAKAIKNTNSISTIGLLNPLIWSSLYQLLIGYPFKGKTTETTPFIRLTKTVTYLPYFDVVLAPYGAEIKMSNVFSNENSLQVILSGRLASTSISNPWSVGAEITSIELTNKMFVSGEIEIWNQPKEYIDELGSFGGQIVSSVSYFPNYSKGEPAIGIVTGMGYKSFGFSGIPSLKESFFGNLGIRIIYN